MLSVSSNQNSPEHKQKESIELSSNFSPWAVMSEKEVEYSLTFLEWFQLSAETYVEELKRVFMLWVWQQSGFAPDGHWWHSRTGGTDVPRWLALLRSTSGQEERCTNEGILPSKPDLACIFSSVLPYKVRALGNMLHHKLQACPQLSQNCWFMCRSTDVFMQASLK